MKKLFILAATSTLLFACQKEKNKSKEYKSDEAVMHGGKTWSSVKTDSNGKPKSVSIVLTDALLNSVPVGQPSDHVGAANNIMVPVSEKGGTPYKFIMVNWNSSGHEPDNIYTRPHFDFHFYTTTPNEVMAYTDDVKMNQNRPAADYIPANYIAPGPGLPMMGLHWIDVTSPELAPGGTFTQTFIYGSYDSKIVFLEPMITLEFLKNNSNFERAIPQPAKVSTSGYYPTKLRVIKHDGVTEVVLDNLTYRQAQ